MENLDNHSPMLSSPIPSAILPMPKTRLPKWLVIGWGILIVASGLLAAVPDEYSIGTARLDFLGEEAYVAASRRNLTSPGLNGFFSAPRSDGKMMTVDGGSVYLLDPVTLQVSRPSGLDINVDIGEDDSYGTVEGGAGKVSPCSGKCTYLMLNSESLAIVIGRAIQVVSGGGARTYYADQGVGVLPFAVRSSDTELLIAGDNDMDLIVTPSGRVDDAGGQSKIFKYDLSTQKLSDTGKLTPVRLGGDGNHRATWRDLGDRVLVWDKTGGLWVMNKRTLSFKLVGTGLQSEEKSKLIYQLYPVNGTTTLISPAIVTLDSAIYLYNSRWGRLTKINLSELADPEIWTRAKQPVSGKVTSGDNLRYIPVVGGRFLSLIPYQSSDINSQLDFLWGHRLVLDLSKRVFMPIANQPVKMSTERISLDQIKFQHSVPISTGRSWLLDVKSQDAIYWAGIKLAPFSWLTWGQLLYPLSFICFTLLIGAGLLWWANRRRLHQ